VGTAFDRPGIGSKNALDKTDEEDAEQDEDVLGLSALNRVTADRAA